ncbi:enoyl-CoA delta isomerase 1, mitochondrial-like [Ptychodera flava]|uniref:enoyl-CoA delta isomerase 1, mitochondrial-like n=1 Tax=Ptychodera flava TaxID=63121 RepID=UPI00396A3DA4
MATLALSVSRTVSCGSTAGLRCCLLRHGIASSRLSAPFAVREVQRRSLSTDLVTVETDPDNKDVAILKMNHKPVNGLNIQLMTEMTAALEKLENSARGVILTSNVSNIFSAGLDITGFFQKTPEETDAFWCALQDMWLKLYGSPLVTIAAINGHSPAGGCMLAMSCDYRIMARAKYSIGLNETLLGIVAPFWFVDVMKRTIGHRESEKALQLGTLYTCEQALQIGLVDELCDPDQVLDQAKAEMKKWLKIPDASKKSDKVLLTARPHQQADFMQETRHQLLHHVHSAIFSTESSRNVPPKSEEKIKIAP